jgi:thiamine-monophosphate kinase
MPLDEFDIIKKYFDIGTIKNSQVVLGRGDDCAIIAPLDGQEICLSTDTMNEDVHFLPSLPGSVIASRVVAANLSDLAAMGANPYGCLLAVTLNEINENWLDQFSDTLFLNLERYSCPLIGGNVSKGPKLSITMTVLGSIPAGKAILRSSARAGDGIYVTGSLGDAKGGLDVLRSGKNQDYLVSRYCYPTPRIEEGKALRGLASSMIDVSDGLLADLGHLCNASHIGAELDITSLPISRQLREEVGEELACRLALSDSDDYELCFTIPKRLEDEIKRLDWSSLAPVTKIGTMIPGKNIKVLSEEGSIIEIEQLGYKHF